jgi:hypothetical protein
MRVWSSEIRTLYPLLFSIVYRGYGCARGNRSLTTRLCWKSCQSVELATNMPFLEWEAAKTSKSGLLWQ